MAAETAWSKGFEALDRLTSRAGEALSSRYLRNLGIYPFPERLFGSIRKSAKGLPIPLLFHQLFCFFLDGTNLSLTRFDELAEDEGCAGAIEVVAEKMASSHQVKRFFYAFSFGHVFPFRRLLQRLFLWRLAVLQPEVVILGMDSMVLGNSDPERREEVGSTYKTGVSGFHPFQINWRRLLVDAVFRGGSKHSNEETTAYEALRHLVPRIREVLGEEVPIDDRLEAAGRGEMVRPERVITCYHGRVRDELVHRALKDFGTEALPSQRSEPNAAFFYVMLAAFNLQETRKEDGLEEAVPLTSYATRLRRQVVDIAGKIVRTGEKTILKVPEVVAHRLDFRKLWEAVADPPRFAPA